MIFIFKKPSVMTPTMMKMLIMCKMLEETVATQWQGLSLAFFCVKCFSSEVYYILFPGKISPKSHDKLHWGWPFATKKPFIPFFWNLIRSSNSRWCTSCTCPNICRIWLYSLVVYLFPQHLDLQSFASKTCVSTSKCKIGATTWKENIGTVADKDWVLQVKLD